MLKLTEPTQEQIKEFWEWCGWYKEEDEDWFGGDYPIAKHESGCEQESYPPIDLNNLFKYAVPKAIEVIMDKAHRSKPTPWAYRQLFELWVVEAKDGTVNAVALFWALWQVRGE